MSNLRDIQDVIIGEDIDIQNPYLLFCTEIPTPNDWSITDVDQPGWVMNLVNTNEGIGKIEQVYLAHGKEGHVKGPHLHYPPKTDRFHIVSGKAVIVCRNERTKEILEFEMTSEDKEVLVIPPYISHAIVCLTDCTVLSMPSQGYKSGTHYNQVETDYEGYDWKVWHE